MECSKNFDLLEKANVFSHKVKSINPYIKNDTTEQRHRFLTDFKKLFQNFTMDSSVNGTHERYGIE